MSFVNSLNQGRNTTSYAFVAGNAYAATNSEHNNHDCAEISSNWKHLP